MNYRIAQWIACTASCFAVGCAGSLPEHHGGSGTLQLQPSVSDQAPAIASVGGSEAPQAETTTSATVSVDEAFLAQHGSVRPAAFNGQLVRDAESTVLATPSIEAVAVDPLELARKSIDSFADGATLEELLSVAFANNPAIQELAATTRRAAGFRTQVGLYANPVIGYQGQQLANEGTDQHLIFIQQQLITGNKLELNRAVLNEAVRAQLQELEAQKFRVATDIKIAFYDCVRIQKQLAAIDEFSLVLEQGVTAAEQRMLAGEASKIDLLQTQVQLKQIILDRNQLAVTLDARLREIVALVGMPQMELQGVSGELPETSEPQDWDALEDSLVATSPEYAAAQARIREARAAIRRQESQVIPNLLADFGAGVDNGTNSGMMNVSIGAPIPLFNKNQGNIVAAHAEYCRAVHEAQRIDNAIRARMAIVSGEYARAAEAVTMYTNELLPAAQETLDLAEAAYRAGEQDFIQLLVTRRTYFDTNLAYLAARAQLARARAQVDGYLLSGALNAVINNSGDDSLRGFTLDQE